MISFDTSNGSYSLETKSVADFPAGVYTFKITASVGIIEPTTSLVETFDLEIIYPCSTSKITLLQTLVDVNFDINETSDLQIPIKV